jgi:hypothetical protein
MAPFRILLAAIFVTIVAYTSIVIANHGFGLFPIFLGDISNMGWPGQFNLDFSGFLVLSAFWLAWRNDFTPRGLFARNPRLLRWRPGSNGLPPVHQLFRERRSSQVAPGAYSSGRLSVLNTTNTPPHNNRLQLTGL